MRRRILALSLMLCILNSLTPATSRAQEAQRNFSGKKKALIATWVTSAVTSALLLKWIKSRKKRPKRTLPKPGDVTFFYFRDRQTNQSLTLTYDEYSSDEDNLVLHTTLTEPNGVLSPVLLRIPRSVLADIKLAPSPGNASAQTIVRNNDTAPIAVSFLQEAKGPTVKDVTYSGTYKNLKDNTEGDFVAVTDPGIVVVIAVLLGALCLLGYVRSALALDCKEECDHGCRQKGMTCAGSDVRFAFSGFWCTARCFTDCR